MSLLTKIADALRLPGAPTSVEGMNSVERFRFHRQVLCEKPEFSDVVLDVQRQIWNTVEAKSTHLMDLPSLEIGAGVIPLRDLAPRVISTDIEPSEGLQCVASALKLPFCDGSFRAVVAQNVFHHLPDLNEAMKEFERVLTPGGVVLLVEPYFGTFASLVYPALFASEGYDKSVPWFEPITNRSGEIVPNQAVSFRYFEAGERREFPETPLFEVVSSFPLRSGLRYLLTGALNFRRLAPRFIFPILSRLEGRMLSGRVLDHLAIHWAVVLRKSTV